MGSAQICIVDDNAAWVAQMRRLIGRAGLGDVVAFGDPVEALAHLRVNRPAVPASKNGLEVICGASCEIGAH